MYPRTLACYLCVGAAVLAGSANAALVVYEGFNYSAGTFTAQSANTDATVTGPAASGTSLGLTGNWTWSRSTDTNTNVVSTNVVSSGISFRNLSVEGNKLQWNPNNTSGASGNFLYSSLTGGATTALGVTNGGGSKTIWVSMLLRSTGSGDSEVALVNNAAGATGGSVFGVKYKASNTTVALVANNGERAVSGAMNLNNTDAFLVAKLTYQMTDATTTSFDSGSMWVLTGAGSMPVDESGLGANVASFASASTSGSNRTPTYLRITNASSSGQNIFDEIRVGTSFADVAPVPEPASWAAALGGLALGATLLRRRSRRS